MKILYITRTRIPSEKAHALQIVTMCKVFSELEHEVTLVLPLRKNVISESIWEFYNINESFKVTYLSATPVIFTKLLGQITFWLEALTFGLKSLFIKVDKQTVIFTRSFEVAFLHSILNRRVFLEIHDWPQSSIGLFIFILRRIPYIVVTAQGLGNELENYGIKNFTIAPNGVGEEYFIEDLDDMVNLKKDLGISIDKKIVMYVGSLAYWKGVDTLMEASNSFDSREYQFVIVGGTESEVTKFSLQYPTISFLGYVSSNKLPVLQKLADILVVPNRGDSDVSSKYTSPLKLFAHMASKRPIIVSDLPSIRSIVSEREVFFFDTTVEGLVSTIKFVSTNKDLISIRTTNAYNKIRSMTWKKRGQTILNFERLI